MYARKSMAGTRDCGVRLKRPLDKKPDEVVVVFSLTASGRVTELIGAASVMAELLQTVAY